MVDRLMSYDFILGHIPGKPNAAADFLSRVPQKPNEAIELMIRNTIPIRQIEIEFKTNLPPETNDSAHFSKTPILPNVQGTGNSQSVVSCLQRTTGNNSQIEFYQVVETNRVNLQISAIGSPDPLNNFEVPECTKHLNIAEEQKKDSELQQVRSWIHNRKSLPRTNYLTVCFSTKIHKTTRFVSTTILCIGNFSTMPVTFLINRSWSQNIFGMNCCIAYITAPKPVIEALPKLFTYFGNTSIFPDFKSSSSTTLKIA